MSDNSMLHPTIVQFKDGSYGARLDAHDPDDYYFLNKSARMFGSKVKFESLDEAKIVVAAYNARMADLNDMGVPVTEIKRNKEGFEDV